MVDKNLIVDTISQIGSVALDAAQDNAIDNVNEEVNQALAFERKQERKHVARVFAELGIDRQKALTSSPRLERRGIPYLAIGFSCFTDGSDRRDACSCVPPSCRLRRL